MVASSLYIVANNQAKNICTIIHHFSLSKKQYIQCIYGLGRGRRGRGEKNYAREERTRKQEFTSREPIMAG